MANKNPTLDQLQNSRMYEDRASLEVKKNGVSLTIEKNDDVFVVHKRTPRGKEVENGDGHWKATVTKIYVKRSPSRKKETAWALVCWYYSRRDIAELELPRRDSEDFPQCLGATELVKSDHLDIISINTIDDHLEVHQFDDADSSGDLIESRSWYMRYTIHINPDNTKQGHITRSRNKCRCGIPYQPNARQRYCANCKKWFHEQCTRDFAPTILDSSSTLPASPSPALSSPTPSPLLKRILAIPTARGFISGWARRWETVGTGKPLEEFREWQDEHPHASDDEIQAELKEIDEEFFKGALEHEWGAFVCEECGLKI